MFLLFVIGGIVICLPGYFRHELAWRNLNMTNFIRAMKVEPNINLMRIMQRGLFITTLLFMKNTNAQVLGDIQVYSGVGQPLSARIDIGLFYGSEIRLASVEEYRALGLSYPVNNSFSFHIVKQSGVIMPYVRVSSINSVNELFINLLLEVLTPSGKFIKNFPVLFDPPFYY